MDSKDIRSKETFNIVCAKKNCCKELSLLKTNCIRFF